MKHLAIILALLLVPGAAAIVVPNTTFDGSVSIYNPEGAGIRVFVDGVMAYEGNNTTAIPVEAGVRGVRVFNTTTDALMANTAVSVWNLTNFMEGLLLRLGALEQANAADNTSVQLQDLRGYVADLPNQLPAMPEDYAKSVDVQNLLTNAQFASWSSRQEVLANDNAEALKAQGQAVDGLQGIGLTLLFMSLFAGALVAYLYYRLRKLMGLVPLVARHSIALSYAMGLEGSTALALADSVLGIDTKSAIEAEEAREAARNKAVEESVGGVIELE